MAIKIPVRGDYVGTDVTGLAEFQSGEVISVEHGGTGIHTLTPSSILVGNNSQQMTQVLVAANQLLVGNSAGNAVVATSTIDCGKIGE